jgi:hypothetical protein
MFFPQSRATFKKIETRLVPDTFLPRQDGPAPSQLGLRIAASLACVTCDQRRLKARRGVCTRGRSTNVTVAFRFELGCVGAEGR